MTTAVTSNDAQRPSIGEYLIQRLQDYGIADCFGIPGDYILSFYTMLEESPINAIGCTREDCAGFAADAYARVSGMGMQLLFQHTQAIGLGMLHIQRMDA